MPTNTYVALDKITITSATPSVTFTNIDQTYTDLVLVANLKASVAANAYIRTGNGSIDTTSGNYSYVVLSGDGSTAISSQSASNSLIVGTTTGGSLNNQWGTFIVRVKNYTNTNMYKPFINRFSSAAVETVLSYGSWHSTSAINQLQITSLSPNYDVGSTFSLYGIKAWTPESTPKATGGYVYSDSTYWYHAFAFTGAFVPNQSLTCDILQVAGGGGGGQDSGGGAGAGGLLGFTSQSVTATSYTVTVGAGGVGSISYAANTSGSNSQFGALTASVGGGRGSGYNAYTSATGGSGGGASGGGGSTSGSSGTSGQGYAGGGSFINGGIYPGGGGGGAGGAGATPANNASGAGAGGIGATYNTTVGGSGGPYSFINAMGAATGTGQLVSGNYYYAGGGGGNTSIPGAGGYGGGGNGSGNGNNTAAQFALSSQHGWPSTGGGGGGGGNGASTYVGGNGGSGIVIVRYAK